MAEHAVVAGDEVDLSRRKFLTRATIATGTVGAVFAAVPFIESWSPSESARAQGVPATLDLSKIEPGQMTTAVWRRSPIYVVRRTEEMIARIAGHEALLKDPNSENSIQPPYAHNALRSRSSEFLVLVGTCTHLGACPSSASARASCIPAGRAASSVRATARASTSPAACSPARPPRRISWCRPTSTRTSTRS